MPGRIVPFANGEYYHLFNRGSDKRDIFLQSRDYKRFQQAFYYYHLIGPKPRFSIFTKSKLFALDPSLQNKLLEVLCYCLMPNHFHFLVRQLKENGVSIFMSQIANSYTKYFNTKHKRVGALFQGSYKAVRIETDEQLVHVSRYIHLNPIVSGIVKNLAVYPWSSCASYINEENTLCSTEEILSFFTAENSYRQFLEDQIDYARSLEIIKHQFIDGED